MFRLFVKTSAVLIFAICMIFPASAELIMNTVRVDFDDYTIESIESSINKAEAKTGYRIIVILTDMRFSSLEESGRFAESFYVEYLGRSTSGVVLLLNTHGIKGQMHDYIYAEREASDVITNFRIQRIFDRMEGYLDAEQYEKAILNGFIPAVVDYTESGPPSRLGAALLIMFIADAVIVLGYIFGVKNAYKMSPAKSAINYLNRESVYYRQKSDTYIRTYVTQVRIQSSSSSGGGGGGRSSGGGRSR
ncbi:MAG: TPM domain-containing protein [Oscillospiraceae bacterium]|nr:TPM domain-containing protein [Oscillospiraceae bacterium]